MRKFIFYIIALSLLSFAACKESDGIIGDTPVTEGGQDRDSDIVTGDDYVYHLPVIFHVFYQDSKDPAQYISHARLKEILGNVNELYRGNVYNQQIDTVASENINVVFELAEKDESGRRLATPGVEYIKTTEPEMDCEKFMKDKAYVKYCWNQNDYINVMVYAFKKADANSTTLGISHLPFQVKGLPDIEGLSDGRNYPLARPSTFPYCVSLNALYVDAKYEGTRYTTDKQSKGFIYNSADPNATLAHELGHYLGLYHAFAEKRNDDGDSEAIDNEDDTDYCEDTPSYNRLEYGKWLSDYISKAQAIKKDTALSMRVLAKRNNKSKKLEWTGDNLMDYSICFSMRFTPDQKRRIREVLYYSPLIPGPKKARPATRAWDEMPAEEADLPIRIMK